MPARRKWAAGIFAFVAIPLGISWGAFGFSQGAAVITILSDARVWKAMGLQAAPWRFVVLACGVDYLVREHTDVQVSCTVPSLHLLGDADPFLMESELLLGRFSDRVGVALRHPFGHALPLELAIRHPEHLEAVVEFIREQAAAAPAQHAAAPATSCRPWGCSRHPLRCRCQAFCERLARCPS